jgi:hypothetical protein
MILRAAVGGVGAFCLPRASVVSQPESSSALEITRLSDALFVVRGNGLELCRSLSLMPAKSQLNQRAPELGLVPGLAELNLRARRL